GWLLGTGLPPGWVETLLAHWGGGLLRILGAAPRLLPFFIGLFVPESERCRRKKGPGTPWNWAARDLLGAGIGGVGAGLMIYLKAADFSVTVQLLGAALALILVLAGYTYPVLRYLRRSEAGAGDSARSGSPVLRRMLPGACLGGVALLGTWASIQRAPV